MDVSNSNEYSDQQLEYLSLKAEVEKEQHTLEELTRQVKATDVQLSEHIDDIDYMQNEGDNERSAFEQKLSALQETLSNLKLNHKAHVSDLNGLISEDSSIEETLKRELATLRCAERSVDSKTSEDPEEFDQLSSEHDLLEQNCNELVAVVQEMHQKRLAVLETLERTKVQVSTLEQELFNMRKDVAEKEFKIQDLTAELFDVTLSLSKHKNKRLQENAESNSLYAEVDDKRVCLQNVLDSMKSSYVQQQETHNKLAKIVSHLQKEQACLKSLWLKDVEQIEEDNNSADRTFANRKTLLKELIGILNSEVQEQLIERDNQSTGSIASDIRSASLIDRKDSLIKKMESQLSNWEVTDHLHSVALAKVQKSIYSLRLQIEELNNQLSHKYTGENKFENRQISLETRQPVGIMKTKKADFTAKVINFDCPKIVSDTADVTSSSGTLQQKKSVKISADTHIPKQNIGRPLGRKIYVMKKK